MGLSLNVMKKPIGVVEYDVEKDNEDDVTIATFWNDERLLDLMKEHGKEEDVFLIFEKDDLKKLIEVAHQIDDRDFPLKKEYKERYSNETMLDFHKRWDDIIKGLKKALYWTDWEEENIIVYISC